MDTLDLPGMGETHTRVALTDAEPSRKPIVVEIFPDRLAPKHGWTRNDLALGFVASLCCPFKDSTTTRKGWFANADGEWLAKLDEAKGPFQHPCGTVHNGAFFVVRGAAAPNSPTFHLDSNGTTVTLPNGGTLSVDAFRGTPYRHTNAATAAAEWVRLTGFATGPKMRELHCLLALAEALDGEPIGGKLLDSAARCVLTVLEDVLNGVSQRATVDKLVAMCNPTDHSGRWNTELRHAQNAWLIGPDRPWAAGAYRRHLLPALATALERRPVDTAPLARAARLLWRGWNGQTPSLHLSAHAVLHAHGLVEQAHATFAS
jgi:hypothetical protein